MNTIVFFIIAVFFTDPKIPPKYSAMATGSEEYCRYMAEKVHRDLDHADGVQNVETSCVVAQRRVGS